MNLETAVAELRATKLPKLRQRQLTLEAAHAASDGARELLVLRARQEATEADWAHRERVRQEFAARYEWALNNPPREPEPQTKPKPRASDRPEVRPVRVSWTTPRKPEIVRPERRPEMNEGKERSRAQRELAEIAQRQTPVQRPAFMWDDAPETQPAKRTYSTQPPVELPIDMTHGTVAYRDFKCRCSVCRESKRLSRSSRGLKAPRGAASV